MLGLVGLAYREAIRESSDQRLACQRSRLRFRRVCFHGAVEVQVLRLGRARVHVRRAGLRRYDQEHEREQHQHQRSGEHADENRVSEAAREGAAYMITVRDIPGTLI